MHTQWLETPLEYDGSQLSPHWLYQQTGVAGDAFALFRGPALVPLAHMVDLEDVQQQAPIASPDMLHGVIELFGPNLQTGIAVQRLLMATIQEQLAAMALSCQISRQGDDLYGIDTELRRRKLSVSICTVSATSVLIHFGLNVHTGQPDKPQYTVPVPACGLSSDLAMSDAQLQAFGDALLQRFAAEWQGMRHAYCKVRAVFAPLVSL